MKKAKMTAEDLLREQGLHQINIYELLYPKETEDKHEERTIREAAREKSKNQAA